MDLLSCIVILGLTPVGYLLVMNVCRHLSRIGRWVDKIPGPKGLPLIGNLLDFVVPVDEIFGQMRKFSNEYYPTYKYWILHHPVVNIRHPDDVEMVLSSAKAIVKTSHLALIRPWVNDGLLVSTGDKWRGRRKMINPAFTNALLQEFVMTFSEHADKLSRSLTAEASAQGGEVVKDVEKMFSRLSLNIICETAMGIPLDETASDQSAYIEAIPTTAQIFQYRFMRPWLANNWIFSLTKMGKEHDRVVGILHDFSAKIIEERKNYHRVNDWRYLDGLTEGNAGEELDVGQRKNRQKLALLDLLIAAWKTSAIDDEGVQEEVDMFVAAGHDTTASALGFTTLLLAKHKDIQAKCREEVNEILSGLPSGKITMKEVQRMSYLQQCIKEAMRLYTVAPLISRTVHEDMKLRDHFIPQGTEVCIHVYDVHRDPHYWPNPDVFDPDRFSPERSKGRHPYSYLPFGLGPRMCVGYKFAMLELRTVMAELISNFYLETVDPIDNANFLMDFVVRFRDPTHVKLVPIIK